MEWGGLFHVEVGLLGLFAILELEEEDANLVLVGDETAGMDRKGGVYGLEGLGEMLLVGK